MTNINMRRCLAQIKSITCSEQVLVDVDVRTDPIDSQDQ